MSRVIKVSSECFVLEVAVPAAPFIPANNTTFFVPDLLSLMAPVKSFEWKGSKTDYMLLSDNMVFKTEREAFARYCTLKALITFVDTL